MYFNEPQRMVQLLEHYSGTWMIAGGWAIDLFLNRETREHHDIELAIPRTEQLKIQSFLKNWEFQFVQNKQFFKWESESFLDFPIHEIHGVSKENAEERIEILLNEIKGNQWKFRRNLNIEYPLDKTIFISAQNIPILAPEIVLLFKAGGKRDKDFLDFSNCLPSLSIERKKWLKNSIQTCYSEHSWLEKF